MRILVTGHRGNVGVPVARHLAGLGYDVAGFDRVDGKDLLDPGQVKSAAAGCAAVVHLGALAHDTAAPLPLVRPRPRAGRVAYALATWPAPRRPDPQ